MHTQIILKLLIIFIYQFPSSDINEESRMINFDRFKIVPQLPQRENDYDIIIFLMMRSMVISFYPGIIWWNTYKTMKSICNYIFSFILNLPAFLIIPCFNSPSLSNQQKDYHHFSTSRKTSQTSKPCQFMI